MSFSIGLSQQETRLIKHLVKEYGGKGKLLLFVGIGNPGEKYKGNRHNIGFMAVDAVAHRISFTPWRTRFQGYCAEGFINDSKVLLLKPMTYVNDSGRAVQEATRFYKILPDDVFVFHDDLDLAPTKIRIKQGGGHGGHNGLRSIDAHLGKGYWRIRQGIGHPGEKSLVHDYVLGNFSRADQSWLTPQLEAIVRHIDLLVNEDKNDFASKVGQDIQAALKDQTDKKTIQEFP